MTSLEKSPSILPLHICLHYSWKQKECKKALRTPPKPQTPNHVKIYWKLNSKLSKHPTQVICHQSLFVSAIEFRSRKPINQMKSNCPNTICHVKTEFYDPYPPETSHSWWKLAILFKYLSAAYSTWTWMSNLLSTLQTCNQPSSSIPLPISKATSLREPNWTAKNNGCQAQPTPKESRPYPNRQGEIWTPLKSPTEKLLTTLSTENIKNIFSTGKIIF